jgi:hypothetical protein
MKVIEVIPPGDDENTRERYWISYYRENGGRLTNATDGGDGASGVQWSREARLKLSESIRGRSVPVHAVEQMVETKRRKYAERIAVLSPIVVEMYTRGVGIKEIKKHLRLWQGTVTEILAENGVPLRPLGRPPKRRPA